MADGTPIGVVDPDLQRYIATRMVMDADLVCRAREDPNVYVEACGRIEAGQWVGRPPGAHRMMQDHLTRASNNGGASTALVLMPVGHAKTTTARWRIEWEIGRNVNLRVLMMSATSQLPEGVLSGIKGDITDNPFTQAVFPHLRPGRKMGQSDWSSDRIHVHRSDNLSDPTIQCAGLTTKILGKRLDLIYLDDMLNTDNTLTPYMRKQVSDKVQSEVMSRRVPHLPSRAWLTGHVWTEDDLVSTMMRQIGAYKMRLGARVQRHKSGRIITSADPEWSETLDWCPLLPGLFTKARLEARYRELGYSVAGVSDYQRVAAHHGIEGAQVQVFRSGTDWTQRTRLIALELDDWLMPWKGTSRPFFSALAPQPYDYLIGGEAIFCFRDPKQTPAG